MMRNIRVVILRTGRETAALEENSKKKALQHEVAGSKLEIHTITMTILLHGREA